MSDITQDIIALIQKRMPEGKKALDPADKLKDLGIDSLSVVELIFDLEEKFNIQIPYNANDTQPEFETVGEVIDAIRTVVAKQS